MFNFDTLLVDETQFNTCPEDWHHFSTVLGNADLGYSKALELHLSQNAVELQLAWLVRFRSVTIRL